MHKDRLHITRSVQLRLIASVVNVYKFTNSFSSSGDRADLTPKTGIVLLDTLVHRKHSRPIVISSLNQLHHPHHLVHQPISVRILRPQLFIA